MNKNTLLLILSIIACLFGLAFLSQNTIHAKITAEEDQVKQRNAIQEIIDSIGERDAIFNSSLLGKTVVLNISLPFFGATKRQSPGLTKLADDFRNNKNIIFLAVFPGDTTRIGKSFEKASTLYNYTIINNSRLFQYLPNSKLIASIHANSLPLNIVFNKEGRIELTYSGDKPEAADGIRSYLNKAK